ncbi:hypothetical protein ECANGB1_1900 [Enterospora canceri]|uniref:Uncharacterized protein n=1 Tax=Enterospora canceri TaxID=1081671 RepID=A0A1Y1S916_9MICR|nr:hypothetical protein ECANGB1_1900 [Enterospora canceri]
MPTIKVSHRNKNKEITLVCKDNESVGGVRAMLMSNKFVTSVENCVLTCNGIGIKDSDVVVDEMHLVVQDNSNSTYIDPDDSNILINNGKRYRIKEIRKKLTYKERIDRMRNRTRRTINRVVQQYATLTNVNMAIMMAFLAKFNTQMFMFVLFIKMIRFFSRSLNDPEEWKQMNRWVKVPLMFFCSLFFIDHQRFIQKE